MSTHKPRRPTHVIKVMDRDRPEKGGNAVGVGWANEDRSLTIHLNIGVVLSWKDNLAITAFPMRPTQTQTRSSGMPFPDPEIPPDPEDT